MRWDAERAERQLDRLRRVAAEAVLQSRRVWLPELVGPVPAAEVLPSAVAAEPDGRPLGPRRPHGRRRSGGRVDAGGAGRWRRIGCRSATPCCASRLRLWSPPRCSSQGAGRERMAPFGVYVHVPFCAHRCDYCAFATWTDRAHLVDAYLARSAHRDRPGCRRRHAGSRHGVRRRRHSDVGARRGSRNGAARDPARAGRRGHGGVQPRRRHRGDVRDLRRRRRHPRVDRRAVDGAARARRAGPDARPGERRDRRRRRARRRLGDVQPRHHLRRGRGSSSPTGGRRWSARSTSVRRTSRPTP